MRLERGVTPSVCTQLVCCSDSQHCFPERCSGLLTLWAGNSVGGGRKEVPKKRPACDDVMGIVKCFSVEEDIEKCSWRMGCVHLALAGGLWCTQGGKHRRQGEDDHTDLLLSPLPSSLAGVNSFMVYMAYKDWYQVSNTEVTTHHVWFGVSGWVSCGGQ